MGMILGISLKLNFTQNTLGCYGLNINFFLIFFYEVDICLPAPFKMY